MTLRPAQFNGKVNLKRRNGSIYLVIFERLNEAGLFFQYHRMLVPLCSDVIVVSGKTRLEWTQEMFSVETFETGTQRSSCQFYIPHELKAKLMFLTLSFLITGHFFVGRKLADWWRILMQKYLSKVNMLKNIIAAQEIFEFHSVFLPSRRLTKSRCSTGSHWANVSAESHQQTALWRVILIGICSNSACDLMACKL